MIPSNCHNGIENHTEACLMQLWQETGCLPVGSGAPANVPVITAEAYAATPLRCKIKIRLLESSVYSAQMS